MCVAVGGLAVYLSVCMVLWGECHCVWRGVCVCEMYVCVMYVCGGVSVGAGGWMSVCVIYMCVGCLNVSLCVCVYVQCWGSIWVCDVFMCWGIYVWCMERYLCVCVSLCVCRCACLSTLVWRPKEDARGPAVTAGLLSDRVSLWTGSSPLQLDGSSWAPQEQNYLWTTSRLEICRWV